MKGQTGYIMKPMMLIAVIILLIFLLQTLYSGVAKERLAQKNLDIVSTGTNVLLILANSEDCLAYESSVTQKAQGIILDIQKLDEFDVYNDNMEPECARNYEFGWRVDVEQIGQGGAIENNWDFGAKEFSDGVALNNEIRLWIPVAIKYPEGHHNCPEGCTELGKMSIKLVNGELENLAGFFDWGCRMGQLGRMSSFSTELKISQPVKYKPTQNELCIGRSCRSLICHLLYFDEGLTSEGTYELTVNYQGPNKLLVGK
ncbi:MAG: hypothetical protein GF368_01690 [Candidatus Aenigmarchaeota archaeon]|nr:hypothetical protein [Candidatus Aenigmarchaeota archaeon]